MRWINYLVIFFSVILHQYFSIFYSLYGKRNIYTFFTLVSCSYTIVISQMHQVSVCRVWLVGVRCRIFLSKEAVFARFGCTRLPLGAVCMTAFHLQNWGDEVGGKDRKCTASAVDMATSFLWGNEMTLSKKFTWCAHIFACQMFVYTCLMSPEMNITYTVDHFLVFFPPSKASQQ